MKTCEEYVLNELEKSKEENKKNTMAINAQMIMNEKLEKKCNNYEKLIKCFLENSNISKFSNNERHYLDLNFYGWDTSLIMRLMANGILNFLKPEDKEILLNDYPDYNEIDKE